jgi:hypothetical protein
MIKSGRLATLARGSTDQMRTSGRKVIPFGRLKTAPEL